jgi:Cys-tRNA(Pro) deacylase
MSDVTTPVTEALNELGVDFTFHVHQNPVRSLQQAAQERGLQPDQVVRSLLFRLEDGSFVLVLVSGPDKVDWAQLRQYLGVSRMTTASADEVEEVTGYEPGAVSPFGLRRPLRILADRGIVRHDRISLGAGIPDAGIELDRRQAMRLLSPEWGEFRGRGAE